MSNVLIKYPVPGKQPRNCLINKPLRSYYVLTVTLKRKKMYLVLTEVNMIHGIV